MSNIEYNASGNALHVIASFDPFSNAADVGDFHSAVYEQARAMMYKAIEETPRLRSEPLEIAVVYEIRNIPRQTNQIWTGMIDSQQPDRLSLRHRHAAIHVNGSSIMMEGPNDFANRRYLKSWTLVDGEPETIWNLVLETKQVFTEPYSLPDSPNELLNQMRRWGYLIHENNPRSPVHAEMPGVWRVIVGLMTAVPRLPTYLAKELSNDYIPQAILAYDKLHHFIYGGPLEAYEPDLVLDGKYPAETVSASDEVLLQCVVDLLSATGTYNILYDEMVNKTSWADSVPRNDPDRLITYRLTELLTERFTG